jgi:O-antigen ligase
MIVMILSFAVLFIYLKPYLDNIVVGYSHYTYVGIMNVIKSHPILAIDGNSTWRLVLWKEIIIDAFPQNIFGLGFGTPAFKYFPVEDYSKLSALPYVIGAHNSFVYLFGRLGIVFLLLITPVYIKIFKEYFHFRQYYRDTKELLIFYSFFSFTLISLFNPTLESPIYASGFWFILGLLAKSIFNREFNKTHIAVKDEDSIRT